MSFRIAWIMLAFVGVWYMKSASERGWLGRLDDDDDDDGTDFGTAFAVEDDDWPNGDHDDENNTPPGCHQLSFGRVVRRSASDVRWWSRNDQ